MTDTFHIAFICTGNTCRSPVAETLFRKILQRKEMDQHVRVSSAGIQANAGMPASDGAKKIAKAFDFSLDEFTSKQVDEDFLEDVHLIFVMETQHRDYIEEHFPHKSDQIRLLGSLVSNDPFLVNIMDPYGADAESYAQVAKTIDAAVEAIAENFDVFQSRFFSERKYVLSIGTDHRGYASKNLIREYLESLDYPIIDCGTHSADSCDHPQYAFAVSEQVALGRADRGILICSSGHGMVISSNKVPMVRAVLPFNPEHAKLSRSHNNANVLVLGADYLPVEDMKSICNIWLKEDFLGGKYQRRINMISAYESGTLYQQSQPV